MSSTSLTSSSALNRLSTRVIVLCWFLVLLDGLDLFVYGASLPGVLDDRHFGLTKAVAGNIGSFNTFGMLIGALSAGVIADRVGRRKVIATGVVVFCAAAALCGAAPSVTVFGTARFVAGLGLGVLLPTAIAQVMEYSPPRRRHIGVTILMTAHQAGGAIAGAVAMSIVSSLGWRSVYWFGAAPVLLALPAILLWLPESVTNLIAAGRRDRAQAIADRHGVALETLAPERDAKRHRGSLRSLFTGPLWRTTTLFWIASFMGLLLVYGVNTWLPEMMRGQGYNLGPAISFLLVINVGGIAGMLAAGSLSDRLGSARPVAIAWFAATALGIGLLAVPMPLWLTYVDVFLTGGFLFSAQTLIYSSTANYYLPGVRGTALGWVSGMGRFGAVFGPWLGGVLVAASLSTWGFGVFALAAVLAVVMITLVGGHATPVGNAKLATAD